MKNHPSNKKTDPNLPKHEDLVTIGKIIKPHGIRGEIRTQIITDFPERFEDTEEIFFVSPKGEIERHILESARFHSGYVLLTVKGIKTIEQVDNYRNWEITVPNTDLVELEEDEYWHFELVGLKVEDPKGNKLGTFKEVIPIPGHDVYAIQTPEGKELLVPAVKQYVLSIDLKNSLMVVDMPDYKS